MQKESILFFSFSSESIFGEANVHQTMKRMLETKYGKPTIVDEYFLNDELLTDYGRMRELTEGNA